MREDPPCCESRGALPWELTGAAVPPISIPISDRRRAFGPPLFAGNHHGCGSLPCAVTQEREPFGSRTVFPLICLDRRLVRPSGDWERGIGPPMLRRRMICFRSRLLFPFWLLGNADFPFPLGYRFVSVWVWRNAAVLVGFQPLPAIPVPPRLNPSNLGKIPLIRSYTMMISEYILFLGQLCDI